MNARRFLYVLAHCFLLTSAASNAGTLVQFHTTLGDMIVELYDQDKPVTVANFLRYVDSGRYTNIFFHRCVPGFVVQGGGFGVTNPASTGLLSSVVGVPAYDPITNEFGVGQYYSNVYGTIAMAKTTNSPDTATCQWFFNLADNSANLDNQNGGFTVFGRVIKGTNVLEQFNIRYMCYGIVNLGGVLSDLPVVYAGCVVPQYQHLIYVDVEPLSVELCSSTAGVCNVFWNGVEGMTNILEYADSVLSGSWQTLLSTNPPDGILSATDPVSSTNCRVYRIRVE